MENLKESIDFLGSVGLNVIVFDENTIQCMSCGDWVLVDMVEYGNGHIAGCPKCGKLAYNGK